MRGIFYWTLLDNIEWHEGYHMKFGLYEWNVEEPEVRKLRPHSKALETLYNALPNTIAELRNQNGVKVKEVEDGTNQESEVE